MKNLAYGICRRTWRNELLLVVGNTLREHLCVGGVERGLIVPHRFAFTDAGVAIHVRGVLGVHLSDQEFALSGAVVYGRSYAEKPAHGGFGVREIGPRG